MFSRALLGGRVKGQVIANTNCSKENSSSIRKKISVRLVRHWVEGGEMTEKLWNYLVLEMKNLVLGKALSSFTSEGGSTFKVGSAFSRDSFQCELLCTVISITQL